MLVIRLAAALLAMAMAGGALVACGDGDDEPTAEEQALLDDERYGSETLETADYSAQMEADDGRLSIVPSGDGGDDGTLSLDYFGDTNEIQESMTNVDVRVGSVIAFRDYRIRVVTIDDRGIAIRWAKLTE